MPVSLEVFDFLLTKVVIPEPTSPSSITLPIGGGWEPNDWRIVVACGDLWKAFSYVASTTTLSGGSVQQHWLPAPPPAGWTAIANTGLVNSAAGSDDGTKTVALARKLADGDADGEFSLLVNADILPNGTRSIRPWYRPVTPPALIAFTIRGVPPGVTPVASFPAFTSNASPTTYWQLGSRTISTAPSFELAVFGLMFASVVTPSGWTVMWDNGYSFENAVQPSYMAGSAGVIGKKYTATGSSGTTRFTFADGAYFTNTNAYEQPPFSGRSAAHLYEPFVITIPQAVDVTIPVNPGTAETYTSGTTTAVFGTNVAIPIQPGPVETYVSGATYSELTGYGIANPYLLTGDPVASSAVRWRLVATPGHSGGRVLASLDWGRTWTECTNGGPVPGLRTRDTVTDAVLFKVELWRDSGDVPKPRCYLDPQITVDAGRDELVPLGTFLIKESEISVNADDVGGGGEGGSGGPGIAAVGGRQTGGGRVIRLKATDLSLAVSEHAWEEPYFVKPRTPYSTALRDIVTNRLPGQTAFDIAATLETTPLLIYGTGQGADPWQDIRDLAIAIGWDAYFDPYGRFVARPVTDPALASPVWTFTQLLGPPVVSVKRSLARSEVYNHIVVDGVAVSPGTGLPVVPAHAEWKNLDPNHPTFVGGKFGIKPYRVQLPAVTSDAQAQVAADALGILLREGAETVEVLVPPVPFLEYGDVVALHLDDAKIDGNYLVHGAETPGGISRGQSLTLFRQSRAT